MCQLQGQSHNPFSPMSGTAPRALGSCCGKSNPSGSGLDVVVGPAPFVLFGVPDVDLMRKHLESKAIAVRRCDTFVGLPDNYLRATVRAEWPVLVDAVTEVLR